MSSRRFTIASADGPIGYSALEGGDAREGSVYGRFYPNEAYAAVQPVFRAVWNVGNDVPRELFEVIGMLELRAETEDGEVFSERVGIVDPRDEWPREPVRVEVTVASREQYARLFPERIRAFHDEEGEASA
jgi:hypothetical protein